MPGRLRQTSGRQSAASKEEKFYNIDGLEYGDALSWRAGKAVPVAELLDRLQRLGKELRGLEQGEIPAQQFTQLAQDLAHTNLLGHKDKGIRAWTLTCIVDILNICAPDAPFRPAQLKDIFMVIVNTILVALADPSNAYNNQHIYILNSMVDTKSAVLITDIQDAESLIVTLFTVCFDVVSGSGKTSNGAELTKAVEFQLRSLLIVIIDEATLPTEVVDIIVSQFLRVEPRKATIESTKRRNGDAKDKNQDTLLLKDYPPAYNMAKAICTSCTERMTGYVGQYFNTIIMNATAAMGQEGAPTKPHRRPRADDANSDEDSGDDEEGLNDLVKAHRLVRELWRACPDVLVNVVPQIESELLADSVTVRQLATETLGDIIAGIGISGPPAAVVLDPAAYPLPSIDDAPPVPQTTNPLLTPASPKPFAHVNPSAYKAFIGRHVDKATSVRIAWAVAASRILLTNAGGIGLGADEQTELLKEYTKLLKDTDDKVRGTAVRTLDQFSYHTVVEVLASDGGLSQPGTLLTTLADRVTDRRPEVREIAITNLSRMWGVASRDIGNGIERVATVLGDAPTKILAAMYTNDVHIHTKIDQALYENLLPLSYPPSKLRDTSSSQKQKGATRENGGEAPSEPDPDSIRVRRIITLLRGLDQRSKLVFFGMQKRQVDMSKAVTTFLKACEEYNGGIVDDPEKEKKLEDQLKRMIDQFSKQQPDSGKAAADLWKFVKLHDRRAYQLIRFATGADYDFRTMAKAIREFTKRIRDGAHSSGAMLESLMPVVYRCALIVFNKSNVSAIMAATRSDQPDLADTANELLTEISSKNPDILKSHIQALCEELEANAPRKNEAEWPSASDTLKVCAAFAAKHPSEVPKERKFLMSLMDFALLSTSPRAAKHATSIILTVSDKKEFYAQEIAKKALKSYSADSPHRLALLASIGQVCLMAPAATSLHEDGITRITMADTLELNRSPREDDDAEVWQEVAGEEASAKTLALKVLVNRCRSEDEDNRQAFDAAARPVLDVLMRIIKNDGEITPDLNTSLAQTNRLRLDAVHLVLKLCSHKKRCEELVTPSEFISLALVMINPPIAVRTGLAHQLKKYLSRNKLHHRWFTVLFLIAFEPDAEFRASTVAWLKSRMTYFNRQQKHLSSTSKRDTMHNPLEIAFCRLLSLLAHHPDYPKQGSDEFDGDLLDFANYIIFYLRAIANEENVSLIFYVAQRVKQTEDAITGTTEANEHLYVLCDLAQATIRHYVDLMPAHAKGVNVLQPFPGKVHLPTTLFKPLPGHARAQEIAEKNYLPEDMALNLEHLVRKTVRSSKQKEGGGRPRQPTANTPSAARKRKTSDAGGLSEDEDDDSDTGTRRGRKSAKKSAKLSSSALPIRKTPKTTKRKTDALLSEQPSRKSARVSSTKKVVNYVESEDSGDDDMEGNGAEDDVGASSPIRARQVSAATKRRRLTGDVDSESSPGPERTGQGDHDMTDDNRKQDSESGVEGHEDEGVEEDKMDLGELPTDLATEDDENDVDDEDEQEENEANAEAKVVGTVADDPDHPDDEDEDKGDDDDEAVQPTRATRSNRGKTEAIKPIGAPKAGKATTSSKPTRATRRGKAMTEPEPDPEPAMGVAAEVEEATEAEESEEVVEASEKVEPENEVQAQIQSQEEEVEAEEEEEKATPRVVRTRIRETTKTVRPTGRAAQRKEVSEPAHKAKTKTKTKTIVTTTTVPVSTRTTRRTRA